MEVNNAKALAGQGIKLCDEMLLQIGVKVLRRKRLYNKMRANLRGRRRRYDKANLDKLMVNAMKKSADTWLPDLILSFQMLSKTKEGSRFLLNQHKKHHDAY